MLEWYDQCRKISSALSSITHLVPQSGCYSRADLHRLWSLLITVDERIRIEYFQLFGFAEVPVGCSTWRTFVFHQSTYRKALSGLSWCLSALFFFSSTCTFHTFISLTLEGESIQLTLRWSKGKHRRNSASVVSTGLDFFEIMMGTFSTGCVFQGFLAQDINPVFTVV